MTRSGVEVHAASPSRGRGSPSQSHRAAAASERQHGGLASSFELLSRVGPAITSASFPLQPQAASVITAMPPDVQSLPDHLLQDVLRLVLASLRGVGGVPARDAARSWTNLVCVCRRWAALLVDEPIRLMIATGKWPAILAALPASRLPLCSLEFYTGPDYVFPARTGPLCANLEEAREPLADLLASKEFQRRNSPHLEHISAVCGLPAAWLPLSSCHPCPWSRLQYLDFLTVDFGSINLLRQLPPTLRELHLTGSFEHRHDARGITYPAVEDTMAHLSSLSALHLTCLHIASAQLPQALDRLHLKFCTSDTSQAWPSGMSVRWEGPMHPKGIRSVLLVRDGADVPTQWQ